MYVGCFIPERKRRVIFVEDEVFEKYFKKLLNAFDLAYTKNEIRKILEEIETETRYKVARDFLDYYTEASNDRK